MTAAREDITLEAGAFWTMSLVYQTEARAPISLVGYGARMMIRAKLSDVAPAVSLTMGSGIALGTDTGSLIVTLDGTQTAAIAAAMQKGLFDLWLDPDGAKSPNSVRVIAGEVNILMPVTR
jgi:hypothetical protein